MKISKSGFKEGYQKREEQKRLQKEYGLDPDVVVVERKSRIVSIWRTTLRYFFVLMRIVANAIMAVLAMIGILTIVMPNMRSDLILTLQQFSTEIKNYIGV